MTQEKQTTYRLTCSVCGKSYQTDKKRGERITKLLEKNPDYLKTYKCRSCTKQKESVKTSEPVKAKTVDMPKVEVSDDLSGYIPKTAEKYVNRKIGGVKDEDIIKFHLAQKNPILKNVLLVGESGTGKTALIQHFCHKYGLPYYRVVMNAGTTTEDIVGQMVMDSEGKFKFEYQVLIKFMQKGGIFVFDEINAGQKEILHILNSVTDYARSIAITQHKGEVVNACENFLVVACMNPPHEYDLDELSKSLKSRFMPYYFDYDEKIDLAVLGDKENKLVKFATAIRKSKANVSQTARIDTPLSLRDLIQFVSLRDSLGEKLAKEMLISKFHNGEKSVVKTLYETYVEKSNILNKDKKEGESNVA